MDKKDERNTKFLWDTFDELGFDYEQIKSLAISMLLKTSRDKTFKEMYDFLLKIYLDFHEKKYLN